MLNPDSVGRTFPGAKSFPVTASEIAAFAAVIGEDDLTVAPPTFSIRISHVDHARTTRVDQVETTNSSPQ